MHGEHGALTTPETPGRWRLLFGFTVPVSRSDYAAAGFTLMAIKYAVEVAAVWAATRQIFAPVDFLNPLLSGRRQFLGAADWLGIAWIIWTLPFLWIAVTMSVRRAMNAGLSPASGLAVLVPGLNYVCMLLLVIMPPRPAKHAPPLDATSVDLHQVRSAIVGVAAGIVVFLLMVVIDVYVNQSYGESLFIGTPTVMATIASIVFNRPQSKTYGASVAVGLITIVIAGVTLLLFALEGVICVAMAAPILVPMGAIGGVVGKLIADTARLPGQSAAAMVLFLPVWSTAETLVRRSPQLMVETSIEIDAPIDRVWETVIAFPDLSEPDEWYFRLGISCPMRATIDGHGVGATRRCIFTTGTFVEPITVWDAPQRLAFDVTEQPSPMFELTPYSEVRPPHLDGAMKSHRGEFRLERVQTANGAVTRLIGRTWYTIDMQPHAYWTLWSDTIVHRIHQRVLVHIREVAQRDHGLMSTDGAR